MSVSKQMQMALLAMIIVILVLLVTGNFLTVANLVIPAGLAVAWYFLVIRNLTKMA